MKNQSHPKCRSLNIIIAILFIFVGLDNTFAAASDCANPFELNLDRDVKIRFCEIPAAEGVLIGSENGAKNERPVKPRNFKKFHMAQFEVTQLQFSIISNTQPWNSNWEAKIGNNLPAVYISYNEAMAFAQALSLIDKTATYRLPTEAEFEYAARAGTTTDYYWGDEIDTNIVYFSFDLDYNKRSLIEDIRSCPNWIVNQRDPGYCANNFGLFHMMDNVAEFTADDYFESYVNAPYDGNVVIRSKNPKAYKVIRGMSIHNTDPKYLRSTFRNYTNYDARWYTIGFRVVRIAK